MLAAQPFEDMEDLHANADAIWWSLAEADWVQAFSSHPKIGERPDDHGASSEWSRQEQARAADGGPELSRALARLNAEYQTRFGFIFIVCASGKSARDIVSALESRMGNTKADEMRIAAGEQAKIMHLRLDKLFKE
jgi:2-oxo-4-hydroxy-4-carboxy-5-ureidoimidazoline decarboxylase